MSGHTAGHGRARPEARRDGAAIMVVGATSGAGKSTVAAALCRAWSRKGHRVAPFKAQNMSNHSAVTPDGGEVGRAQAVQAHAAGVETDRRMNPILLKPSRMRSHVVVLGEEVASTDAHDYGRVAAGLRPTVLAALTSLRDEHDIVVAEGAGGAAEINLLDRDLVNLPLAAAAGIPAVLVVDIDRGGAFAAAHGTLDLLPAPLRRQVVGVLFNSFRGDASLLERGVAELEQRDGVPVLGVLPHLGEALMLGLEDSLDVHVGPVGGDAGHGASNDHPRPLRVAAVRYPSLSNPSDLDPLLIEPSVQLRWVEHARDLDPVDLIVLPGSRATVSDLAWLHARGFADALRHTEAAIVGLCGGYQMLGELIIDHVESGEGEVAGLGLLSVRTTFAAPKVVRRSRGTAQISETTPGAVIEGYQIRWGRPEPGTTASPWLHVDGVDEGVWRHAPQIVCGTSVHGLLDEDDFRRQFLARVADSQDRHYMPGARDYREALHAQAETLADWAGTHLDLDYLLTCARGATPVGQEPGW
ncbi:MAG: cobyric acid synthase [Ornithinimicrobium sp.]